VDDLRRHLLLQLYADVVAASPADAHAGAIDRAVALGLTARSHSKLCEVPARAAVRVVHSLQIGPAGLQLWSLEFPDDERPGGPRKLAVGAARLLAGQERLLLLIGTADGLGDGEGDGEAGALIDGDSCGRMTVAGFPVDGALDAEQNLASLAAAGDLIHALSPQRRGADVPTRYVLLGLNLSGGALARTYGDRGQGLSPVL
jgi:hypothetical protein